MKKNNFIDTLEQIASNATRRGVIHLSISDRVLGGHEFQIDNKSLVNFGSCSFLGLEFDHRIRNGAKKAIDDYGSQFSSSRAYISTRHYEELEEKLSKIFNAPTLVTPTTTLGHIAAIPLLVDTDDVVILDHQVHSSVQTAVQLVKAKGTKVDMVRHSRLDLLEEKIKSYREDYNKIWYMADGVYSMYGDTIPIEELYKLLDKYDNFRLYVDDAHGMSCFGENGCGFVLNNRKIHSQMVMATSLNKAFASGGGALIFPNEELKRKVRSFGGPMITSGPMQPSGLGAAIASADIHLSSQIKGYQDELNDKIMYAHLLLKRNKVLNLSKNNTPIFFIGVGLPRVGYNLVKRMMNDGFFMNLGIFPAVPIKNTGVRFTITRLHTFEQIEKMVESLVCHYPRALEEEGSSREEVYKAFKIELPEEFKKARELSKKSKLVVAHRKTILDVPKAEWNAIFGDNHLFDWHGLNLLEHSFKENDAPERNWEFDYITIKDVQGDIVLSTFLTTTITKDDMLSPKEISFEVEKLREKDHYFLTSKTLQVGSLLTEGEHLYINKYSKNWKQAVELLLQKMSELQEINSATSLVIRDLPSSDAEMDDFMLDNGYFKVNLPDNSKIKNKYWNTDEELCDTLSKKFQKHFKQNVLNHKDKFEVVVKEQVEDEEEIKKYYELYLNVKNNNLELNTYDLPFLLFENMCKNKDWEMICLYSKETNELLGVCFCHKGKLNYSFVLIGMSYSYMLEYNTYRQSIYRVLVRARSLGYSNINLGYSAVEEDKKFGAIQIESCAYIQVKDNFNMEALNALSLNHVKKS